MMTARADPWSTKIEELFKQGKLTSHQCTVYNKDSEPTNSNEKCGCQRLVRHHSFDGTASDIKPKRDEWTVEKHTKQLSALIYRSTPSNNFLRCACENQDDIETMYELMSDVCKKPRLIISVYGGRKYFTMNEEIEKEFMDSLAEAAMTPDTWIITSGLNNGAAKLIGEGIARRRGLTDSKQQVTLIGMAWWGNITEKTRTMVLESLQEKDSPPQAHTTIHADIPFHFDDKDIQSLERNHTYLLLLDDGRYGSRESSKKDASSREQNKLAKTTIFPKEMQRSDFVTHACEKDHSFGVTVVVEGGINACLAILNDILHRRPVIVIQGSGKMADVIASLMELTAENDYTPARMPNRDEIEHNLRRFPMRARTDAEHQQHIKQIQAILDPANRMYLTVYRMKNELNLKQTILHAVFKAQFAYDDDLAGTDERLRSEHLLRLAIKWNCFEQATDLLEGLQYDSADRPQLVAELFKQALDENRPSFIDFFLRINFDPRQTFDYLQHGKPAMLTLQDASTLETTTDSIKELVLEYQHQIHLNQRSRDLIFQLYQDLPSANSQMLLEPNEYDRSMLPTSDFGLDRQYSKWVGDFMAPLFSKPSLKHRLSVEIGAALLLLKQNFFWCKPACCIREPSRSQTSRRKSTVGLIQQQAVFPFNDAMGNRIRDGTLAEESIQEMMRDLLFWTLFTSRFEMAKVLILHIRPRICAALICAAVLRNLGRKVVSRDKRHLYKQWACDFETYATDCINACFLQNERKACELLIREIPLFGRITCMQIAISARCSNFINTSCFSQVLNRVWFNKLAHMPPTFFNGLKLAFSLVSFGLLAPWLISYRPSEESDKVYVRKIDSHDSHKNNQVYPASDTSSTYSKTLYSSQLSYAGVNYCTRYTDSTVWTWKSYIKKIKHFHQCPMVKMCYHFASYIWFLLVFSYMMLFKFNSLDINKHPVHWTEFYTIATISIMLLEDIRRNIFYYITYMRESEAKSWVSSMSSILLHATPYVLFYVGIFLRYTYGDTPHYVTTARIILALDLEIWYLLSLKFICVVKSLGPKVFMVRNMLRDLFSFLYVAFICIAAYGVVSRAMIKYDSIEFNAQSIFSNVFYRPYWFLYAEVSDEINTLDALITNTDNTNRIGEAIATHVLLAFHMIFISIVLLNVLIAVFATSISKVESNTQYFWRYQRYTFIQEYFEKPILPASPIIFVCYLAIIVRHLWYRLRLCCTRKQRNTNGKYSLSGIFRIIPIDPKFTERCTAFEHAATYAYARHVVESRKENNSI